jgi:UDP-glucose 4-epimerase
MLLLTGGCGFIGSNLIRMMIKKGHEIRVLDNLSKGSRDYIEAYQVEFVKGDIRDSSDVSRAMDGVGGVIHLAAYGSVVESVQDPEENFDINVRGTFTVLNEARKAGVKKVVFSSTGGALIGNAEPPVNEDSLPRPISPYGSGKLCCEAYCSSFAHSYDMNITALRFANVIGPVSWHKKGAVTAFMKSIINDNNIKIYGDGTATRDFLYVDDLCWGIISAYEKSLQGFNPIHLAGGKEVSVRELADLIISVSGKIDHPIEYLPGRRGEVDRNFANYDLANKLLGFEPKTPLNKAIELTWEWFQNQ